MILKLFDSLTPLDQLILKCASVIGETVNRHMLESLMAITSKRDIGLGNAYICYLWNMIDDLEMHNLLALTKLFEIRIFGCAIGDFTKTKGPIIFIKNIRNNDSDVFCKCIGLTIPGTY